MIDDVLNKFKELLMLPKDTFTDKKIIGNEVYLRTPPIINNKFPKEKATLLYQKLGAIFLPNEIDGEKMAWIFIESDAPFPEVKESVLTKQGRSAYEKNLVHQGLNKLGQVAAGVVAAGATALLTYKVTKHLVTKLLGK